jgi:hypothetical protein
LTFDKKSFLKSLIRKKGITDPISDWCQNLAFQRLYANQYAVSASSVFENFITKLFVNGSFWGLPMRYCCFFCIGEFRFAPFTAIHSFIENEDLVSFVNSIFLMGFDNEI